MTRSAALPVAPSAGRLHPLSVDQVRLDGGFWGAFRALVADAVVAHCDDLVEESGWVGHLRDTAAGLPDEPRTWPFTDSEIYKIAEAMSWLEADSEPSRWSRRLRELTEVVAAAQQEDGYVGSAFGRPGQHPRYSDLAYGHELYCMGHLIQAGVAAARSGGPALLFETAVRAADHVCREFGPTGRVAVCGHPEIETALVELYRQTGERRYLEQARLFVERRGHGLLPDELRGGRDYYQDATPVREATVLVGHAVRALYLLAGAVDVAVETGDDELLAVLRAQFDRTLATKTYLTGGMGSRHSGEAFGEEHELPSDRAYAETCAAVAAVHVAWRLLLATGDTAYADYIETALYNAVVPSPSPSGDAFFYVNTLHRRVPGTVPAQPSVRRTDGLRARWFTVSCCPANVARLSASLPAYLATADEGGIQVHQYVSGRITVEGAAGQRVLEIRTEYPDDGRIRVVVGSTDGQPWELTLRVPAWSTRTSVRVNGEEVAVTGRQVRLHRTWAAGDEVELDLDVRAQWVYPHPRVDAVRGCVAVRRGPLVYCVESVDNRGADLDDLVVYPDAPLVEETRELTWGTTTVVHAAGAVVPAAVGETPYALAVPEAGPAVPCDVTLVPYFRWANRGSSTMRVWTPAGIVDGSR